MHAQRTLVKSPPELWAEVSDPGSCLEPRLLPADPMTEGGFGLRLVDRICSAWGFDRDAEGRTRVWCEVPLGRAAAG